MSRVLVDSLVWIEAFRSRSGPEAERLIRLVREDKACVHGLVRAEVLSGARDEADYARLAVGFGGYEELADPPDLWERVGRARYALRRRGISASSADAILAVTAAYHGREFLTLARGFEAFRSVLPFRLYSF